MIDIKELRKDKRPQSSTVVHALLDRLEAWEAVFGHLGTPDEVGNEWRALSDRLEAAEKERDFAKTEIARLHDDIREQDESVRKAWSRFINELHRSPNAPYPGMSEAFEQHFSQSFTDREWRAESATWAAAWKAAKNHGAQAQPAPSVPDEEAAYSAWFHGEQGVAYDGMWAFAKAAWMARAALNSEPKPEGE